MKKINTRTIVNVVSIIGLVVTVYFTYLLFKMGVFRDLNQMEKLLAKTHGWAPLIFIFIQIVQVVIPIIPGSISLAAGVLVFGPLFGFIYNYVGIVLGSYINFILARRYGKPIIEAFVSEKTYEKYSKYLDKQDRFDKIFAVAIFLPMAPDDALCFIAGLTEMKFKTFSWIILLGKPLSIAAYSFILLLGGEWINYLIK